ncbi:response regulator [Sporichthya sp.]|uniref:response regulator transcription factor n=1 Tax=Sporichthya sp. TaxID=65475 RepID=UPI0017D3EA01|nr:response regulator [Sporichthya sp.]MBA3744589.1 response regulator [Sporichthya sp.]
MTTTPAVLIVEDDTDVRELLRRRFSRSGYHAVAVASGEAGLAALEWSRPCLAVVDIGLPGMSGWEFIARFRERTAGAVPVCVVSALDPPTDVARPNLEGYVTKPVGSRDIQHMLNIIDSGGS